MVMRLEPGAVIDGFVLGERIAVGGMGSIWTCTHPDHAGVMVLKAPFLGAGADVSTIVAYEVEEMILRRLKGHHVPRFVAAGDLRTLPYIVMEHVAGDVLESRLTREGFAPEEVARIGSAIAIALEDIHRQHVIHLDLKPGNVILSPRGAVLIDFGLARHDHLPDLLAEESDTPMGTAATISPEQILGDRSHAASDVFALGCVLYELATGEKPFGEPTTLAGQRRRLFRPPPAPRAIAGRIPMWLQEVILTCLEVDPANRYATAAQVLFALRHPDQVTITERGRRTGEPGLFARLGGWFGGRRAETRATAPKLPVARRLAEAPIVLAAVDLANGSDPLAQEVRLHVARALAVEPRARLACLTVLRTRIVGDDPSHDSRGRTSYVSRLVALKDWARAFDLPDEKVSFHVVEAVDVGGAIVDYAVHNKVDHVVLGARASGGIRRHLGSVSSAVVAAAPCTVTVVRLPAETADVSTETADVSAEAGDA